MRHKWSVVLDRLVLVLLAVILLVPPAALPFSEPVPQAYAQVQLPPTHLDTFGSQGNQNGEFGNNGPWGIDVDSSGNVWVMDYKNEHAQKFSSDGTFLSLIGSNGNNDDQFKNNGPRDVAVDSGDNFWITDSKAHKIKKFDSTGTFLLSVGSSSGDSDTKFNQPSGVAVDSSDNIYVADTRNEKIKKYDSNGNHLLTFGSNGNGDAQFKNNGPFGVAVDSSGNIWVTDTKAHKIKKFDSAGNFLLSFGSQGSSDDKFRQPHALAIDSFDNVWIADTNNDRIVAYDQSGNFLTKYGTKNSATGFGDNGPRGIVFDIPSNIFYVTDTKGNVVHKLQNNLGPSASVPGVPTGLTATAGDTEVSLSWTAPSDDGGAAIDHYKVKSRIVGSGSWALLGEIPVTSASVSGLTNDSEYEFEVSAHNSAGDGAAASVTATPVTGTSVPGIVSGLSATAGNQQVVLSWTAPSDGGSPITDYTVQYRPTSGGASSGNIIVSDKQDDIVQIFDSTGNFVSEFDNDFDEPEGVTVDSSGNIYVVDKKNDRIQKFDSSGNHLLTFGTSGDGELDDPADVAVDSSGNIYVSDKKNDRVVKFDSTGNFVSEINEFNDDEFDEANGVGIDSSGNIYVSDKKNDRVVKFDSTGNFVSEFDNDFDEPEDLFVDSSGNTYVVDKKNDRIQKFDSSGNHLLTFGTSGDGELDDPAGVAVDSSGNIYVSDKKNDRVVKFDSTGNFVSAFTNNFNEVYGIAVTSSSSNPWLTFAHGDATVTETVTGLTNDVEYEFRIIAVNSVGSGNPSSNISSTPTSSETVPGIPTGLTSTAGDSEVSLSWTAPSDGGSAITDYTIQYRATTVSAGTGEAIVCHAPPGNPSNTQTLVISDSAVSTHIGHGDSLGECTDSNPWLTFAHGDATVTETVTETVTGLTNDTEYEFRIIAVNSIGSGTASDSVFETPAAGATSVPGIPTNLIATAGAGQVSLSWTAPSDGGSPITDYLVEYSDDGTTWNTFAHGDDTTSETITGLTNGQQYFFRVSAINAVGTGDASGGSAETVTSYVSDDDDDAEEEVSSGDMYLDSSDLELTEDGGEQEVGIRFNGITIPQGTTITSAHVQFTTDSTDDDPTSLTIFAEDADDSSTFESDDDNISSRTKTSSSVSWSSIPAWNTSGEAGDNQKTPDLKTVIQEVIDRAGWSSGNSISIIITGTGVRTAESHEGADDHGDSTLAPRLTINYGSVVSATPQAGATIPDTPTNLSAIVDDTQVLLTWTAPYNGGSPITDYLVEYSDDGSTWNLVSHGDATTSQLITGLTNGQEYSFRVAAENSLGTGSYTLPILATPNPANVIEVRVNHDDDDAEEDREGGNSGDMYLDSSDLELTEDGDEQEVGMRFNDITIPSTAVITSAHVQFTVDELDSETTNLTIFAEDTDNSFRFDDNDENISSRTKTSAQVSWSPVAWNSVGAAGDDQKTPDIKALIQEVIDRAGWSSGNSISIIITGDGQRTAESHDGDSNKAPLLVISYTVPITAPAAPVNLAATPGNQEVSLTWTAPCNWWFPNY